MADYLWEVQRFDSEVGEIVARLKAIGEIANPSYIFLQLQGRVFPLSVLSSWTRGENPLACSGRAHMTALGLSKPGCLLKTWLKQKRSGKPVCEVILSIEDKVAHMARLQLLEIAMTVYFPRQ